MSKKTPNCAICKWLELKPIPLNRLEFCQAQGFKYVSETYNNKLCKKLYEPKEKEVVCNE